MSQVVVQHDETAHRFVATVNGVEAYLWYRHLDDETVDFRHTFVPPELRRHGLAEALVRAGFAWAGAEGFRVRSSCSYVTRLVSRDPDLEALTVG